MKVLNICILILLFCTFKGTVYATESVLPGTLIKSGYVDNASYGPFNIGFNFTFFGNTYSQFYVNSNGQVLFGAGSTVFNDAAIPTAALPNNFIAAFWDDLVVDGTGKILYTTIGGAPNRKLIIQFNNMGFYGSPPYMGTFAVIINETTNVIQVQYRLIVDNTSTQAHGASASIGLENSDGTIGVQYLFHTEGDIHSGKAISFTPSGSTYTTNSDALYEEVFLTTNITLPEPGIPTLLNPPQEAEISPDFTFSWSDAGNTSSYALLIADNSALAGATYYDAGTNLSYDVTGLTVDATYYWGVFATNATGSTWCEIKKFIVKENPPLIAVAQTIKVEQNHEKSIQLQYAGGDASTKTAIITALPANGHLYQYNSGVKGALILSVPTILTDAGRNVIYLADGSFGNGAGNFKYKMHDDTGDSPEALITVNVSPPGMPNLLYVAKNTGIEMQFDLLMANPAGKENQFTVTVNSTPVALTSLSIKTGDPYTIVGTLATPLITGTEAVTIAYTAGDVASAQGGWLDSFNAQIVTLNAQTITFTTNLTRKFNESPFVLSATASSGLPMTYSSSNLTVATISGSTVTLMHLEHLILLHARQEMQHGLRQIISELLLCQKEIRRLRSVLFLLKLMEMLILHSPLRQVQG